MALYYHVEWRITNDKGTQCCWIEIERRPTDVRTISKLFTICSVFCCCCCVYRLKFIVRCHFIRLVLTSYFKLLFTLHDCIRFKYVCDFYVVLYERFIFFIFHCNESRPSLFKQWAITWLKSTRFATNKTSVCRFYFQILCTYGSSCQECVFSYRVNRNFTVLKKGIISEDRFNSIRPYNCDVCAFLFRMHSIHTHCTMKGMWRSFSGFIQPNSAYSITSSVKHYYDAMTTYAMDEYILDLKLSWIFDRT